MLNLNNIEVSIIIRTRNEEKYIKKCLEKIKQQKFKNFEIILADNYSNDLTVEIAKQYVDKIIKIKNFTPGKAINKAIKNSKGKIIVILSAHCIPVNNLWLTYLIKHLKNSGVAGVYGRQEPMKYSTAVDKRDLLTVFGLEKKIQKKDTFFHNANSAIRRDVWFKIPFDERVTNIEDRVWGEKVILNRYKIIYEPKASVYHFHGINQNLDKKRAKSVVRILESLDTFKVKNTPSNYKNLNILALIPLKGESIIFNNKPLLKKTIDTAFKSKYINDVVVATDNLKTAKLAKLCGAKVPFVRPAILSQEKVKLLDVLSYSIKILEKKKIFYDLVIVLSESYPFREQNLIDRMIERLVDEGLDTLVAGYKESRGICLKHNKKVSFINDPVLPRAYKKKQVFATLFGLCCVTHPINLRKKNIFQTNYSIFKIDDALSSIDINNSKKSKYLEKSLKKLDLK